MDRFKTVLASGRQAALVPEGGGVIGNLVAAVASKLIIPAKGPVEGDTPEAIFAKAEYYLDHGELSEAVDQLRRLRGMPASIVRYIPTSSPTSSPASLFLHCNSSAETGK
jgi:hypothetical protein